MPVPPLMITAEDVAHASLRPDCYLLAAERLGYRAGECLVFEDAMPGIVAAEAAGATVVVITAIHLHPLKAQHPSIATYDGLTGRMSPTGLLELRMLI